MAGALFHKKNQCLPTHPLESFSCRCQEQSHPSRECLAHSDAGRPVYSHRSLSFQDLDGSFISPNNEDSLEALSQLKNRPILFRPFLEFAIRARKTRSGSQQTNATSVCAKHTRLLEWCCRGSTTLRAGREGGVSWLTV
jgi:hypothetical protein